MDTRNRITLRLPYETIVDWDPAVIAQWPTFPPAARKIFTAAAATRLDDAVKSFFSETNPGLPMSNMLIEPSLALESLAEQLEWLRRRLKVVVPASPDDLDLAPAIQLSHEEAKSVLEQMGLELTKMKALTGMVLQPTWPAVLDLYTSAAAAASKTMEAAQPTDAVSLDFCMALLLSIAGAIPPPLNGSLAAAMEWAANHGLLPQDRMIGVPVYGSKKIDKTIAKIDDIFVILPPEQQAGFTRLASVFASENRCANVLLQAHQISPEAVKCNVEYEIRRLITKALLSGWTSLRGFQDEAAVCQHAKQLPDKHRQFLSACQQHAGELETSTLSVMHLLAASSWVYHVDFLRSLDPLLTETKRRLSQIAEMSGMTQPMVEYLRMLRILPPSETADSRILP